jgi:amidase
MSRRNRGKFDPDFATATDALDAIRQRVISSRELTAYVFERIRKHNPKLNLFITLAEEQAMARAAQADETLAKKKPLGRLHGLPIGIKDVFATQGIRTTSGSKDLKKYTPEEDAVAVARLKDAGAVIIGKTNMPEFAGDWQAFNQIAGTSNNPWDITRTPGGSTGGGAASLAAGFTFLELGGDLAGSLRIPSHFCGVYGHKPTIDLVPMRGHIPPPPGVTAPASEFAVAGPLARSAEDLLLALEVIAGPDPVDAFAYSWSLPAARKKTIAEYRIGYVIDDKFCRVDSAVKEVLANAIELLRKSGAQLSEGWPSGVHPKRQYETWVWLLAAFFSQALSKLAFKGMQKAKSRNPWIKGTIALHREWLLQTAERLKARAIWQEYFQTHDAFLMPVTFVAAFPHDHNPGLESRKLMTSAGERRYTDLPMWTSIATLTGCPATIAPVGQTKEGLPVGIQIMGPFLEDATPIDIAQKMSAITGGFTAPSRLA